MFFGAGFVGLAAGGAPSSDMLGGRLTRGGRVAAFPSGFFDRPRFFGVPDSEESRADLEASDLPRGRGLIEELILEVGNGSRERPDHCHQFVAKPVQKRGPEAPDSEIDRSE